MIETGPNSFTFSQELDSSLLNDLYEGDLEYAEVVFGDFLKYLPNYFSEVEQAFTNKQIDELRKAVHKCKTLMGFVGLSTIQATYQAVEKKCENSKSMSELDTDYRDLKQQTESGKKIITKELDRLKEFNGTKK
ncbi:MAG TPA: Hpt domain-containing protein [Chitinophagaceae bacterium]|nr:Hpt domain-containing protein [Chitinophagaceae bacterium]